MPFPAPFNVNTCELALFLPFISSTPPLATEIVELLNGLETPLNLSMPAEIVTGPVKVVLPPRRRADVELF